MHILVLTDRDWTHPQGGGTGTNLYGQAARWLDWGHRVTVIACGYPGAVAHEQLGRLTIHRIGGRVTVFPRTLWEQARNFVPDADVVLEVINGITFMTPLWLRSPRVALVHHVHRGHYAAELGTVGRVAALFLETLPLKLAYRRTQFLVVSESTAGEVEQLGIPAERIAVNYNGVEASVLTPGERAPEPTLLYLGRLKRYKRLEVVLDTVQRIPGVRLEVAGAGDYHDELVRGIDARGIGDRVRVHGHVSEERKRQLLQRAWVNVTASSAEGWCLTVLEAAACATPTVAIAAGGLRESVVHGRTGLLAQDGEQFVDATRLLIEDADLRARLGAAARERAEHLSWERTAAATLDVLREQHESAASAPTLRERLQRSDSVRAIALAGAVMTANLIALAFTIVFARLLGASGYGDLAALVSAFLILSVAGSALQLTVAREVSAARADDDPAPTRGIRRWVRRLSAISLAVAIGAVILRRPLAEVIGVDAAWAAAAAPVAGCVWLVLCVQRGALQGYGKYRLVATSVVGEALGRLLIGLLLVAIGWGVTGAFLGLVLSIAITGLLLAAPLESILPAPEDEGEADTMRLRTLFGRSWAPVIALALLAVIQNVDVIVVQHESPGAFAGSYAAAAVAAKAIIWLAIGLGLYLLPEVARRASLGLDARPMLRRTLVLIAAVSLPILVVYTFFAEPLLELVYGSSLSAAASALPWLAVAMTLLACAYLSVQYLLALRRSAFLWVLALAAVVEPFLLRGVGAEMHAIAFALLGLQLAVAGVTLVMCLRFSTVLRSDRELA
jgi:glycosyltransferase involved in cell wall biosynthesis/O-antigen/teichoic acid export membrane protein